MSEREQLVKTYIGRILSLQQQKKDQLQQAELKDVARELGLSESEIAEVEKEASDHFERGQGFVRYARWDDAITELKEALSFSPLRVDVLHELASAYQSRYKEKQQKADREEARRLAKQTLELNPKHEPSFALLNALDQKPAASSTSSLGSALFLGLAIVPIIAGLGYVFSSVSSSTSDYQASPSGLEGSSTPRTPSVYVPPKPANEDVELPVEFEAGEKGPGLVFHNRGTILNNYIDSSFLKLLGEFENTGKFEYSLIKLQMQLIDAQGVVVEAAVIDALADYQAPIRPKDTKGFYSLKQTSPTVVKVRLTVQLATSQPAPSQYDDPKELVPQWSFAQPSHLKLFVGERSSEFSPGFGGKGYHKAWLIFENRGEGAIKELKVQLSYFDKGNTLLSTDEGYVTSLSEPSVLPGQRRPLFMIESVLPSFDHYTVSIIEAR